MPSSRLARNAADRLVAVVTTCDSLTLPRGTVLVVLGNLVAVSVPDEPGRFAFLEHRTGRPSGVRATVKREPDVEQRCEECGTRYTIAARSARRGARPLCSLCRGIPEPAPPTPELFDYWTSRYSPGELEQLAGAFT